MMLSDRYILLLLLFIQFLIYVDRGIIPSCVDELSRFIVLTLKTTRPDIFIGLLQSSFIIGVCIGAPIFAHLTHVVNWATLMSSGIFLWALSGAISGWSRYIPSYGVLLFGRICSGMGEAVVVSLVPPLILEKTSGLFVGIWMGCFCAAIPIGISCGFCYGSVMTQTHSGWNAAFVIESIIGIPIILCLYLIGLSLHLIESTSVMGDEHNDTIETFENKSNLMYTNDIKIDLTYAVDKDNVYHNESYHLCTPLCVETHELLDLNPLHSIQHEPSQHLIIISPTNSNVLRSSSLSLGSNHLLHPTFIDDVNKVMNSPIFMWLAIAYSSYAATVSGLSTFGSTFLQDLALVSNETGANVTIGLMIGLTGIIGSIIGGCMTSIISASVPSNSVHTNIPLEYHSLQRSDHLINQKHNDNDKLNCLPLTPIISPFESSSILSELNRTLNNLNELPTTQQPSVQLNEQDLHQDIPSMTHQTVIVSSEDTEYDVCQHDKVLLIYLIRMLMILVIISVVCLTISCYLGTTYYIFVGFFSVGLIGLFATQSGLNIAIMLSVYKEQRACAIALATLILHIIGDVPSPIIIGFMKDILSPGCIISNRIIPLTTCYNNILAPFLLFHPSYTCIMPQLSDYQQIFKQHYQQNILSLITISPECQADEWGTRLTLFITTAWLGWMIVGLYLAIISIQQGWYGTNNPETFLQTNSHYPSHLIYQQREQLIRSTTLSTPC